MIPLLAVAGVVGVLAPVLTALAWRVPFGLLSVGMVLRAAVGAALATVVVGTVAWAGQSLAGLPAATVDLATPAVGGAAGLFLSALAARRLRRVRGALVLALRLRDPEVGDEAEAALGRQLARAGRGPQGHPPAHATLALMVAAPMTRAGRWQALERWLGAVDLAHLDPRTHALLAQALSTCRMHLGDLEGAEAALSGPARPVEDAAVEAWLATTEALLAAVRGDHAAALAAVGEAADPGEELTMRASKRAVRAHAWAARGETRAAEEELSRLWEEAGDEALERMARPAGPATELAERLRESKR